MMLTLTFGPSWVSLCAHKYLFVSIQIMGWSNCTNLLDDIVGGFNCSNLLEKLAECLSLIYHMALYTELRIWTHDLLVFQSTALLFRLSQAIGWWIYENSALNLGSIMTMAFELPPLIVNRFILWMFVPYKDLGGHPKYKSFLTCWRSWNACCQHPMRASMGDDSHKAPKY